MEETSNEERKVMAKTLGQVEGEKSSESCFKDKSEEDISELMKKVRMSKEDKKLFKEGLDEMVENMRKSI